MADPQGWDWNTVLPAPRQAPTPTAAPKSTSADVWADVPYLPGSQSHVPPPSAGRRGWDWLVDEFTHPRKIAADVVRVGSGVLAGLASDVPGPGSVAGGAIGGAGEGLAQWIRGEGADPAAIAVAAGVGAIPMGPIFKGAKYLSSAARGAALNTGILTVDDLVHGKLPELNDLTLPAIVGAGMGAGGRALTRIGAGRTAAAEAATERAVPPKGRSLSGALGSENAVLPPRVADVGSTYWQNHPLNLPKKLTFPELDAPLAAVNATDKTSAYPLAPDYTASAPIHDDELSKLLAALDTDPAANVDFEAAMRDVPVNPADARPPLLPSPSRGRRSGFGPMPETAAPVAAAPPVRPGMSALDELLAARPDQQPFPIEAPGTAPNGPLAAAETIDLPSTSAGADVPALPVEAPAQPVAPSGPRTLPHQWNSPAFDVNSGTPQFEMPGQAPLTPEDRLRMVMGGQADEILGSPVWRARQAGKPLVRMADLGAEGAKPIYTPKQLADNRFLWGKERGALKALDAMAAAREAEAAAPALERAVDVAPEQPVSTRGAAPAADGWPGENDPIWFRKGDGPPGTALPPSLSALEGPKAPKPASLAALENLSRAGKKSIPKGFEDHFQSVLEDARANGYSGSADDLASLYAEKVDSIKRYQAEQGAIEQEAGTSPQELLKAISDNGGFDMRDKGYAGELRHLFESLYRGNMPGAEVVIKRGKRAGQTMKMPSGLAQSAGFKGIPNIVNAKSGMLADTMLEALQEDPRFAHRWNGDLSAFMQDVDNAMRAHWESLKAPGAGAAGPSHVEQTIADLAAAHGVEPGNKWWGDVGSGGGSEAGFIDPRLASTLAGAATGAVVGPLIDQNDPRAGALGGGAIGALMGLAAGHGIHTRSMAAALEPLRATRYANILSGMAVPKKIMGDVGQMGTQAATDLLSGRPERAKALMDALFSRRTLEDTASAWRNPNMAHVERGNVTRHSAFTGPVADALALPSRALGAITEGAKNVYKRAGFSPLEADRNTFTNEPNDQSLRKLLAFARSPLGNWLMPVAKIPINLMERGLEYTPGIGGLKSVRAWSGASPAVARARQMVGGAGILGMGALGAMTGENGPGADYEKAAEWAPLLTGGLTIPAEAAFRGGRMLSTPAKDTIDALMALLAGYEHALPLPTGLENIDLRKSPKASVARWISQFIPYGQATKKLYPVAPSEFDTRGTLFGPAAASIPFGNEWALPRR